MTTLVHLGSFWKEVLPPGGRGMTTLADLESFLEDVFLGGRG